MRVLLLLPLVTFGQDDPFDDLPSIDAGLAKEAFDSVCEEAFALVAEKVDAARADWSAAEEAHSQTLAAARKELSDALERAIGATSSRNKIEEALSIQKAKQALEAGAEIPLAVTGRPARGSAKFKGSRFMLIPEELNWFEARTRCEELGGRLATIANDEEQVFLASLLTTVSAWVGAQDAASEGDWRWIDGSDVTAWAEGQPDNWGKWEHSAFLHRSDGLKDGNASVRIPFLCEWGPPTAPPWNLSWRPAVSALEEYGERVRRADSERDEARGRAERSLARSRSTFLDKVTRAQRVFGDALKDAVRKEVRLGRTENALRVREVRSLVDQGRYRPRFPVLDPATAPPEESLMVGWQRVQIIDERLPWRSAEARCRELGGRLLVVGGSQVLEWLKTQAEEQGELWVGGSKSAQGGKWSWLDGTAIDPAFYAPGNPSNSGGNEDHLQAAARGLNDRHSEVRFRFVCEWPK